MHTSARCTCEARRRKGEGEEEIWQGVGTWIFSDPSMDHLDFEGLARGWNDGLARVIHHVFDVIKRLVTRLVKWLVKRENQIGLARENQRFPW